jgi:hypothetical protein
MKNREKVFTATMVAFAFAFAPVLEASPAPDGGPYPDGGPTYVFGTNPHHRGNPNDIIPGGFSTNVEPAITIHSLADVTRGKTGTFVLSMEPANRLAGGMYVKFSVDGTAIPGVDYVAVVSPAYVGTSGYGVIQIKTLADPRGLGIAQAYSVVITLEDAAGYAVGQPSSATMWINP